jgi:fibronectin type 3 domain-containing protein
MGRKVRTLLIVLVLGLGSLAQGPGMIGGPNEGKTIDVCADIIPEVPGGTGHPLAGLDGYFTENRGQLANDSIHLYGTGGTLAVGFGKEGVVYDYRPIEGNRGAMFWVSFEGANDVKPVGEGPLPHKSNFFIGDDPDKWVSGASNFRSVLYPDIYDSIDLRFYLDQDHLKYDYIVGPGCDAGAIVQCYHGVEGLSVHPISGNLIIHTPVGDLEDEAPFAYQSRACDRVTVDSGYLLLDGSSVGFRTDCYDTSVPLVIDPGLNFSTFVGGSGDDTTWHWLHGSQLAIAPDGGIIVIGKTDSADFPATVGAYDTSGNNNNDGFVFKLDTNGTSLVFATYIGGSDPDDEPTAVAVDSSGCPYVTGYTDSPDFPTTTGVVQEAWTGPASMYDGFVFKLNASGDSLRYSTYLAGSAADLMADIHVIDDGSAYVCGYLHNYGAVSNFPVPANGYDDTINGGTRDGFIVKLNHNASKIVAGTYFGGSNYDTIESLTVDDGGSVVFAGDSDSNDLPTTPGAYDRTYNGFYDIYVAKLDGNLTSLNFSTYIGGSNLDVPISLDVDDSGNSYVTGYTDSNDFPTTQDAYMRRSGGGRDAYVVKLASGGGSLPYCTYFGGQGDDRGESLLSMGVNGYCIVGQTQSADLPTTDPTYDDTYNGTTDAYVARFNITGDLNFSTYLGGNGEDVARSVVSNGGVNVTVSGRTASATFPTTVGAYDRLHNGGFDIFVTRFGAGPPTNFTAPSVPMNLNYTLGDRSVHLTWDPPATDGGAPLAGYSVYRGNATDAMELLSKPGLVPSFTDTPPAMGVTYYYAVRAFHFLEGNLTEPVEVVPYGTPSAPVDLSASSGIGQVNLEWDLPSDDGGLPVQGFNLSRGTDPLEVVPYLVLGNRTDYVDEDVVNGTIYYYRLRAFNEWGTGSSSPTVNSVPRGIPSVPTSFSLTAGDSQVRLDWREPVNHGGESITHYRVLRASGSDPLEQVATLDYSIVSYIDSGLENGVVYRYALVAVNSVGEGPMTQVLSAIPQGFPGAPVNPVVEAGDGQVSFRWDPPSEDGGLPVIGYDVFMGLSAISLEWVAYVQLPNWTAEGLENGVTYHFAVSARNDLGPGERGATILTTPYSLPDAPVDPIVEGGMEQVVVRWFPPVDTGGFDLEGYYLYRGGKADALELMGEVGPTDNRYTDTDVVGGMEYFYAVSAFTIKGEGPRTVVVSAVPIGPPGQPTDLTATAGDGQVSLSWTPPSDDGGSTIGRYVILRGTGPDDMDDLAQTQGATTYTDRTVVNGTTFHYAVVAINDAGRGPVSGSVQALPIRPPSVPGAVKNLTSSVEGGKVTLSWSPPGYDGGSPVTGYIVMRGPSVEGLEVAATLGDVSTWTDENAERGTLYRYSVVAVNDVGQGETTVTVEAKVPKKSDESPGPGAMAAAIAMTTAFVVAGRRRKRPTLAK